MSRGDREHQNDVAAYRRRPNCTPEHLRDLDPQPQIALIVANHGFTTEQQRARMSNVDMCAGSQSQRRGNMHINIKTELFDKRTSVTAAGGQNVINSLMHVSAEKPPMYAVVRSAMHSHRQSMARMNVVTLSSDCATKCTSAASGRSLHTSSSHSRPPVR
jgi:hypothetical protein